MNSRIFGAVLATAMCTGAQAQIVNNAVKIGVLSDSIGASSSWGAKGSVLATQMAVEDFKKSRPNLPYKDEIPYKVEIVRGDFQLKADLAVAVAQKWMDEGSVRCSEQTAARQDYCGAQEPVVVSSPVKTLAPGLLKKLQLHI